MTLDAEGKPREAAGAKDRDAARAAVVDARENMVVLLVVVVVV